LGEGIIPSEWCNSNEGRGIDITLHLDKRVSGKKEMDSVKKIYLTDFVSIHFAFFSFQEY
jgi:hypothetical protein